MWICAKCGEAHQDQFKECWKCVGEDMPEHVTDIATASTGQATAHPERPMRSAGSILVRVAVGFGVGMLFGTAIYHRHGVSLAHAATIGAIVGAVVALIVAVLLWIVFPFQPPGPREETTDPSKK